MIEGDNPCFIALNDPALQECSASIRSVSVLANRILDCG